MGTSADSSSQSPNFATVTYAVIPTTGLATFEQPLALPARDGLVEQPLLGASVVQVMVDHLVTQGSARHRPGFERGDGLPQRRWKPRRIRLVRVSLERRRQLQPVLEPIEPRRKQRRKR